MSEAVELCGVVKSFREGSECRSVLRGVDLSLRSGRLGLVTGASGQGKSTLLSIAGGLMPPDGGSVRLFGEDVGSLNEQGLDRLHRRQVGFVFQTPYAVAALTARENLELMAKSAGRSRDADRFHKVVDRLGLSDALELLPSQMSGGQRRRLSVARCLLSAQPLILADEPTNDLDEEGCLAVMGLLRGHVADGGTVLMVTHDPRWVSLADEVFVLGNDGVIA